MSVGPRAVRRLGRHIICALLVLVAVGALFAYRDSGAVRAQPGIVFSGTRSLYNSLADRLLDPISWSVNVRANTDNSGFGQHEPGLAVSPTNPNVVVVANKDYREGNIKHVWIEASQDGGQTWPTQLKMMQGIPTENDSDPVVIARDDGRIYVSCLTTGNYGVWITWTDDNGVSFHAPVPIVQNQGTLQDKDWFAIDNNPASPFYHRMYMAWAPGGVVSSYSADGGLTWTAPQQIPNSGGGPIEYPYPVVAPNGDVFLFHLYDWTNHGSQPSIVKFVKSTDGGVSWGAPVSVATIYQPDSPPRSGDQWRFFSILSAATDPTNNSLLYVAWTDNRNFNTNGLDVMYSASTDHGASWGQITRLSHDPTGVVRDHITPMLKVDSAGRLNAFWLDRRLDPANHLFQAWYSSSTDGGASWEADSQVSDAPGLGFDLNVGFPPGSGNAAGDYWGLDTAGGYVYTAWTDTRRGEQDIFTSRGVRGQVTPTNTPTNTPTPTRTPTLTGSPTASPTFTWTPSPTPSSTSTFTPTPTWTHTPTSTPTDTLTPIPTDTETPLATETSTATFTPESTSTAISSATSTATIVPSQTGIPSTPTSTATSLATGTETLTPAVSATGTVSVSPTSTVTPCGLSFSDVHSTDYFYEGVQYLVCNGVVSGYADQTFRPYNDVTRAQICKMLVLGFGWPIDTTGGPHFSDVLSTYWAYDYIETVYNHSGPVHIITGYDDGTFRPGNNMTRGQLSKVVALSAQWPLDTTGGPHFTDVTPTNPFYAYIETAYKRGIISGYADRTFRWGNSITRGQTAKILYNTLAQP